MTATVAAPADAQFVPVTPAVRRDARLAALRFAFWRAQTADGLLVAEPGRELLASRIGCVAPIRHGRTALIPGGPLSQPGREADLIRLVERWAAPKGLSPLWLNVTGAERPLLEESGYGATRTGSDCIVPIGRGWSGSQFRAVRAACSRSSRAGVTVRKLGSKETGWDELAAIQHAHVAAKPQRGPATAFVAPPPGRDTCRDVWIAEVEHRTVGFATAHALCIKQGWGRFRWTLGSFHTHPTAPSGTAALLVRTVLDDLGRKNVAEVSLGPAPSILTGPPREGENRTVVRGVTGWRRF
ncbi:MAG: phosphatidylglycerol lysyltransferase domain-containing protein, partial [Planctomycetota bacterium]